MKRLNNISPIHHWTGRFRARFPVVRSVLALIDNLNVGLMAILCLLLASMSTLAFAQVVARYFLGSPLTWSEELLRFALIWLPFLGAGIVVRKGQLIAVEFLVGLLPAKLVEVIRVAILLLAGLFWLVLAVYGFSVLGIVQGMRAGATEVPMWIIYSVIPLGSSMAVINTLAVIFDPPDGIIGEDA